MSPSEKVRALLDERGIEWWSVESLDKVPLTVCVIDGVRYKFRPQGRGIIVSSCTEGTITAEQAIAMTVGVGTCKFKVVINQDPSPQHRGNICECNKCGYRCARGFIDDELFKCCPNCGRRITKED